MPRLALALMLTSLTVATGAQDAGAPGGRGGMMRSLPVVTALDADGSGDISADEIRNAPANLRSLDADRSGALEVAELLPPRGERGQLNRDPDAIAGRLMRFDDNGDGELDSNELPVRLHRAAAQLDTDNTRSLSQAELAKGIADGTLGGDGAEQGRGPGGGGMGRPGPGGDPRRFMRRLPIIAALDRDESGVIEATEIEGASRALATIDMDGDGTISTDEMRPSRGRRF